MERIKLTRDEKTVLRLLHNGCGCPDDYPRHTFVFSVRSLDGKGLVKGAWSEDGELEDARIAAYGMEYISQNPLLKNPVDWKWLVMAFISILGTIAGFAALLVACSVCK